MGLAAVLIAAGGSFCAGWGVNDSYELQATDFGAYYRAGLNVRSGNSPYVLDKIGPEGSFVYAPAYSYVFVPFTYLDYFPASRLWMLLNWVGIGICVGLARRLSETESRNGSWLILTVAGVLFANYFVRNVRFGQVGVWLAVLCYGWAHCLRRGRQARAGMLLAAACFLKILPILLVPFMLIRRQWRGLAGFLAGSCALFLVPAPWLGLTETLQRHVEWKEHLQGTSVPFQTFRPANQSLLGMLARTPAISNGNCCYDEARLAALTRSYPFLLLGLAGLLYFGIWYRGRGVASTVRSENVVLCLLFLLMTCGNPRGWHLNFPVMFLACLLAVQAAWALQPGWPFALVGLIVLAAANVIPSPECEASAYPWTVPLLQGIHFWALVLMTGSLLLVSEWRPAVRDKMPAGIKGEIVAGRTWFAPASATRTPS
jgi:hypothetical protein